MSEKAPKLLSVVKLIELARLYPAGALSSEFQQSYPIPVPHPNGLRLVFLFYKARIVKSGEGLQVKPPTYMADLHADSGEFEQIKAIVPREFGQTHDEDEFIGTYLTLPERRLPEFLTKEVRLFQSYDKLLAPFTENRTSLPMELKKFATEFKQLFPQVAEQPLRPYYQVVGKVFFDWLKNVDP